MYLFAITQDKRKLNESKEAEKKKFNVQSFTVSKNVTLIFKEGLDYRKVNDPALKRAADKW